MVAQDRVIFYPRNYKTPVLQPSPLCPFEQLMTAHMKWREFVMLVTMISMMLNNPNFGMSQREYT
jgi:hypothetical protein